MSRSSWPGASVSWLIGRYPRAASLIRPAASTATRQPNAAPSAKMWPVGWEALEQWGDDVARIEPLTGGVGVNEVWSVRVNGHLAVGRLGQRSEADLAWETDLLRHLDREGMPVPVPIPTTDGRHFADGLVVMTYVEGGPPETEADWRRVAGHGPPAASVDAGLAAAPRVEVVDRPSPRRDRDEGRSRRDAGGGRCPMPGSVVRLSGREKCVVHGDPTRATSA